MAKYDEYSIALACFLATLIVRFELLVNMDVYGVTDLRTLVASSKRLLFNMASVSLVSKAPPHE